MKSRLPACAYATEPHAAIAERDQPADTALTEALAIPARAPSRRQATQQPLAKMTNSLTEALAVAEDPRLCWRVPQPVPADKQI